MAWLNAGRWVGWSALALGLGSSWGCASDASDEGAGDGGQTAAGEDDGAAFDDGADGGVGEDGGFDDGGGTGSGADEGGDPGGEDGGAEDDGGGEPADGGSDGGQAGQLTAGEWRDLDNWDFWWSLVSDQAAWVDMATHWQFSTLDRIAVVVTQDELVVTDAQVVLSDAQGEPVWEARTDAHGRAELFVGLFGEEATGPFALQATSGAGEVVLEDVMPASSETVDPIVLQLAEAAAPEQTLDLMFMIDTTGSMGDELSYLQVELADVIAQVETAAGEQLGVRLSVNFYRDEGDEYLVRSFPFTTDIATGLDQLGEQDAGGGGDYPEAVEAAMTDAIVGHEWSASARARLLFLVLDAPPHDDQQRIEQIQDAVREAARLGVRVIPIAASGVDKDTEFLMRFMDISTGGTYVFLTDDSGIGGEHLEPTIGEYEVELLNALLVRVIGEALALEG